MIRLILDTSVVYGRRDFSEIAAKGRLVIPSPVLSEFWAHCIREHLDGKSGGRPGFNSKIRKLASLNAEISCGEPMFLYSVINEVPHTPEQMRLEVAVKEAWESACELALKGSDASEQWIKLGQERDGGLGNRKEEWLSCAKDRPKCADRKIVRIAAESAVEHLKLRSPGVKELLRKMLEKERTDRNDAVDYGLVLYLAFSDTLLLTQDNNLLSLGHQRIMNVEAYLSS